jgi:hypothetical protein
MTTHSPILEPAFLAAQRARLAIQAGRLQALPLALLTTSEEPGTSTLDALFGVWHPRSDFDARHRA